MPEAAEDAMPEAAEVRMPEAAEDAMPEGGRGSHAKERRPGVRVPISGTGSSKSAYLTSAASFSDSIVSGLMPSASVINPSIEPKSRLAAAMKESR